MDEIRSAIRSGVYRPGERLTERTLAAHLEISHIPIREALMRLADEGLIEHIPRRGARVAEPGPAEIEEVSSLRVVLEQFVVTRVQERLTRASARRLRELVRSMMEAADRGDVEVVLACDRDFHAALWELSEHRLLIETVSQLRGRLDAFLRAATLALPRARLREHAETHQPLLDAILSGDRDDALEATRRHIEAAAERLLQAAAVKTDNGDVREPRPGRGNRLNAG